MWWSRAFIVLLVVALGPVGCGFRPLYAKPDSQTSSPEARELASVRVLGIEDRMGQNLRNELVRRLSPAGEPGNPRYVLQIRLSRSESGLAESSDGKTTVGRMDVNATMALTEMDGERPLLQRALRSSGSYRYLGPRYGSVVAERDTESLLASDLAGEIAGELSSWFAQRIDRSQ